MKSRIIATAIPLTLLFSVSANAALESRLGGLAFYDSSTNLTWLTDAAYGYGSYYDTTDGSLDGRMTWPAAKNWADTLNVNGVTGWRLPDANPVSGGTYNLNLAYDGSTDVGFNITSGNSELGYLYYRTLGNQGYYDTNGVPSGCDMYTCLQNQGSFSNIKNYPTFWTESTPDNTHAIVFTMSIGSQTVAPNDFNNWASAWAVHSGDVAVVPIPPAVYLFASGFVALAGMARRRPEKLPS